MKASENEAKAIIVQANTEALTHESLKYKRKHEIDMYKTEVLSSLARNGKMVIQGKEGNTLLESMLYAK